MNFIKDIFKSGSYDLIKWACFFLFAYISGNGLLTGLVEKLESYMPSLKTYSVHLILGGGFLILFIIMWLWERFFLYRPRLPFLKPDFKITYFKVKYVYRDDTKISYSKFKRLYALRDDATRYKDKYRWTGSGKVDMKSTFSDQSILDESPKNVYKYYSINFNRTLKKKESIETNVVWNLSDTGKTAIPFISATIEEPTDKLILEVDLPDDFNMDKIVKEVSHIIGATKPISSETDFFTHGNSYTWEITSPKLLHHYELRWTIK